MDWKRIVFGVMVLAAIWQGVHQWELRAAHPADGELAPDEPRQVALEAAPPIPHGRWMLSPRARYDISARILSRQDYRFDALADLVPEDLALGWGPMSDNRVIAGLEISQSARFYSWRPRGASSPAPRTVIGHSANTHVIAADDAVRRQLKRLRVGERVRLRGLLVDGQRDDGMSVHTSLTRLDTGAGACEIMLVEQVD